MIGAALRRLQDQEASALDSLGDHAFVEFRDQAGDESIALAEVLRATSTIPGSMAQAIIIEVERADRFGCP